MALGIARKCPECGSTDIKVYLPNGPGGYLGGHYGGDFAKCNSCGETSTFYYSGNPQVNRRDFRKTLKNWSTRRI